MKDNFVLYLTYYDAVMQLTDVQAGQLLKGLYEFAKTGERKDYGDPTIRFAYSLITAQIDASNKQYEETCQRNRANIMKRWNTKDKIVNEGNKSNTTEYDGIRPNTTEYEQKSRIPKIDKIDKIDKTEKEEKEDKKKDEPSMCVDTHSSSSKPSDFEGLMQYWNDAVEKSGSAMNKLLRMTDRRVSAVRARMREHKPDGVDAVKRMIDKAVRSDFLNGKNSRNAIFTFDRLMAPEMFQKTLEGNYDNKPKDEQQPTAEQSSIGRLMQEQEAQRQDPNEEQRQRYEGMIAIVERNPQHRCREALVMAFKNGTLKSLGIEWKPE